MELKKKLQEKFSEIKDVFFEKEMGLKFLRVETTLRSMDDVAALSRKISDYLDEIDSSTDEYYLDVYSAGTEKVLDKTNLEEYVEQYVLVTLEKRIKEYESFEGTLLSVDDKEIVVKWNAKGQFRKQAIELENIKEVKLSTKW